MLAWLGGKLKMLFGIAAIGGPVMAFLGWQDHNRIQQVETEGVEATASIEGATRKKSRRGGTTYSIDLAWKDDKGQPRAAKGLTISTGFANQIIRDDKIVRRTLKVKYLMADPDVNPIVVEDKSRQEESDTFMMQAGAGAGAVGLIGVALMLMLGRRRNASEA
jgi:hypothetical protein